MPVSRDDYLKEIFTYLELLDCDRSQTNLLCYVDGDLKLFQKTREYVVNSKFNERLCLFRNKGSGSVSSVHRRRQRIADIHNEIKEFLKETDYVLLTEDDTLMPLNTLTKMLHTAKMKKYFGFISGVELGRWGFTHIGGWRVDNVYNPKRIESVVRGKGIEEIDASGLYCCLTTKENYVKNFFKPFELVLGPDTDFGINLRQRGLRNYMDFSINCDHLSKQGKISVFNSKIIQVIFEKDDDVQFGWKQTILDN